MQFIDISETEIKQWQAKLTGVETQFSQQLQAVGYPAKSMIEAIHQSTKHYSDYSANQLFEEALQHPFTNITPLNE
jgi:hypothetical protein